MTGPDPLRRTRTVRRLILLALAVAAFAVIHLRSESERSRAQEVCVDGVAEFDSVVTGAAVACE